MWRFRFRCSARHHRVWSRLAGVGSSAATRSLMRSRWTATLRQRSAIGGQPENICSLRGLPPMTQSGLFAVLGLNSSEGCIPSFGRRPDDWPLRGFLLFSALERNRNASKRTMPASRPKSGCMWALNWFTASSDQVCASKHLMRSRTVELLAPRCAIDTAPSARTIL